MSLAHKPIHPREEHQADTTAERRLVGSTIGSHNCEHTHTHAYTRWRDGQAPEVSSYNEHPAGSSQKKKHPHTEIDFTQNLSPSPSLLLSLHPSLFPSLPLPFSLYVKMQCQ